MNYSSLKISEKYWFLVAKNSKTKEQNRFVRFDVFVCGEIDPGGIALVGAKCLQGSRLLKSMLHLFMYGIGFIGRGKRIIHSDYFQVLAVVLRENYFGKFWRIGRAWYDWSTHHLAYGIIWKICREILMRMVKIETCNNFGKNYFSVFMKL